MKSVRIAPSNPPGKDQSVTFVLAVGSNRQACRLRTSFVTQGQALSYLQKHRTALEVAARALFNAGKIEDGIVHLKML
jgi:hypothetical protein